MKVKIPDTGAVGDDLFATSWPDSSCWGNFSGFHLLAQSDRAVM